MEYGYVVAYSSYSWRILVIGSYICVTRIVCRFQPADNQENKQENTADDKFTAYLPCGFTFFICSNGSPIFQDVEYREYQKEDCRDIVQDCKEHFCRSVRLVVRHLQGYTGNRQTKKSGESRKGYEWTRGHFVIFLTDGLDFVFQMCQHLAVYIQVGFAHSVKQKVRQAVQFGICRHQ